MSLQSLFVAQAYDYTTTGGEELFVEPTAAQTAMNTALFLIPTLLIALASYALFSWLTGLIFKKAGIPAWKALVPLYNIWLTFKLGNFPGWWTIVLFVPFVNLVPVVLLYIAQYRIGLKLGKPGAFVLLAIFLPLVWYVWLACDDSKWSETPGAAPATPTTDTAAQA